MMERTPCNYLHLVQVGEWVVVRDNRSGRETPRHVVSVDAERGAFSTAAHTYRVVSPVLAENIKDGDLTAVAVPEGLPVEVWMPYARN